MPRNLFFFIQFFLVALSILFLSHYFVYFSIVHFFSVASGMRKALAVALFLLPASFIGSMILGNRFENTFSAAFYFCSSLWLGVGLTLMVFCAFAWAARGATLLFTHSPSPALFGGAAIVLACLTSGYGIWNAYHPRTQEVIVKLPNLSPEWRGKKAVQLSDLHLGRILGTAFLENLVKMTNAEKPSAVFITGDLFDGRDGRLDELVAPLKGLQAPMGTYFVTGNHETYLGTDRAYAALEKTPVKILRDEMVVVEGLQIIGIGFPERGDSKDLGKIIRTIPGFDSHKPSVLLYHNPVQTERVKAAGIGLQLAGHTHHGQIFPLQIVPRLIFGKYYHGLHVEEGYSIYTSSGAGTWGPTMRTGNHPEIAVLRFE
jgi:uncharacterized protein